MHRAMKRIHRPSLAALTLVLVALAPSFPASADDGKQTLTGLFDSGFQDKVRPLRAVFTPTGERTWDVVFYFKFNGRDHQYKGIAEGGLREGSLSGRVENEGGRRTFTFRGAFEKGTFKGEHFEISRGREVKTGSLTLEG